MDNAGNTFTRFFYVYILFLVAGIISVVRIITVQASKDRVTTEDIYKQKVLNPSRGSILSYDGRPLAVSIPVYEIRWDSKVPDNETFDKSIDSLSICLSRLFRDKSASAYRKELVAARKSGNRYKRIGNRNVDYGELEEIRHLSLIHI